MHGLGASFIVSVTSTPLFTHNDSATRTTSELSETGDKPESLYSLGPWLLWIAALFSDGMGDEPDEKGKITAQTARHGSHLAMGENQTFC